MGWITSDSQKKKVAISNVILHGCTNMAQICHYVIRQLAMFVSWFSMYFGNALHHGENKLEYLYHN